MAKEFEISEINKLLKDLDKKGVNINKGIKKGVTKTTYSCARTAKKLAPVETGTLRANIHSKVKEKKDKIEGTVEPTMEYSVYPEFGTGQRGMSSEIERPEGIHYSADYKGQDAQPYIYPAFVETRDKLIPNIYKELDKLLKN